MNKSWTEYYQDKIIKHGFTAYFNQKIAKNKPFLDCIESFLQPNERLVEAGMGTSFFIAYFAKKGYNCDGFDIEPGILDFGKEVMQKLDVAGPNFYHDDIFESSFADNSYGVSFNLGVMEHFSDEEIISALKEQTRIAKRYIFAIPSANVLRPNSDYFGDERYLPAKHWEELIHEANLVLEKQIGYRFEGRPIISLMNHLTGLFYHQATFFVYVVRAQ
ncbi:MAG: class I SAM-dependent methyltransferase [Patescibacteria group bacterium]